MAIWNLWHGCRKISPGCKNCYVYRGDERYGRDSSKVVKTQNFDLPIKKDRHGVYKTPSGETVYTCFTSDFFIEDADIWRPEAWNIIKQRPDLNFLVITKRIGRIYEALPVDWGAGYDNLAIYSTVENQQTVEQRLPILNKAPILHKGIVCEPLLERIDLTGFLGPWIEGVVVGGESGNDSRLCDYDWILDLRRQCVEAGVPFTFKQTGRLFKKNGRIYTIERKNQHAQARRAGINTGPLI